MNADAVLPCRVMMRYDSLAHALVVCVHVQCAGRLPSESWSSRSRPATPNAAGKGLVSFLFQAVD